MNPVPPSPSNKDPFNTEIEKIPKSFVEGIIKRFVFLRLYLRQHTIIRWEFFCKKYQSQAQLNNKKHF